MATRMRPFGELISLEAARTILAGTGAPVERIERLALADAHGRVLARDVRAIDDVPPFSRAAMDGYAVRALDTQGASPENPRSLVKVGTLYTGQVSSTTGARQPVHRDLDRRANARRRRRRRDGRGHSVGAATRFGCSPR